MKVIRIMLIALILITLTACDSKDNKLYFTEYGNGSRGAYWKYEINSDRILREVDYYEKRGFLNFGPGYSQHWVFEPIGQGEVTISWISYEAGTDVVESECYYVTYSVDDNLNITKTFDSRY